MYREICQKPAHFLSAQMALVSTFFQMFIVIGMYNFAPDLEIQNQFCQFTFRWIYYYGSNKSTGKEISKMHLCALS